MEGGLRQPQVSHKALRENNSSIPDYFPMYTSIMELLLKSNSKITACIRRPDLLVCH